MARRKKTRKKKTVKSRPRRRRNFGAYAAPRRRIKKQKTGIEGLLDMIKKNAGALLIAGASVIGSRAIHGALSQSEAADGSIVFKEGSQWYAVPIAALGPAGITAILSKKVKPAHLLAALAGGVGGALSDVAAPMIAAQLAEIAPESGFVAKLASGILEPMSIDYVETGAEIIIEPEMEDGSTADSFGIMPDAQIGLMPDAQIGLMPDTEPIPDAEIREFGDFYQLGE